ncbi:sulfite exporter TauE/SafE family protein [Ravibacter arvi]|uniref:Sulfite exporter TauE/SafE family protein n=1 Tax=Ravibacter arvi TaxID=2051041 RepID=A0ABP8M2C1_9BACT
MFYLAFILGLTSSLHCVGMCGPIALALPVHRRSAVGKVFGIISYNLGRIAMYALFGFLIGGIGGVAFAGSWQRGISITIGILMAAGALGSFSWWERWSAPRFLQKQTGWVLKSLRERMGRPGLPSLFAMGILNGLIPCGMVYLALVSALTMPGPGAGAMYMFLFGLGTLPAMLATGLAGQWVSLKWRAAFKRATPYLVAVAGIILIVRGVIQGQDAHAEDHRHTIPICVGK